MSHAFVQFLTTKKGISLYVPLYFKIGKTVLKLKKMRFKATLTLDDLGKIHKKVIWVTYPLTMNKFTRKGFG